MHPLEEAIFHNTLQISPRPSYLALELFCLPAKFLLIFWKVGWRRVRVGVCRSVFSQKENGLSLHYSIGFCISRFGAFWLHLTCRIILIIEISDLYQNDTSFLTVLENKERNRY